MGIFRGFILVGVLIDLCSFHHRIAKQWKFLSPFFAAVLAAIRHACRQSSLC